MQYRNKKTSYLLKVLGETVKKIRETEVKNSINKLAHGYDLDVGNTSRLENGLIEPKFITLWKIAESLNIPLSELIKNIEKEIPKNFNLAEE